MTVTKVLIAGACALLATNTFAFEDFSSSGLATGWSPVVTLSAGPAWSASGQTQSLGYDVDTIVTYNHILNTNTLAAAEMVFSLQRELTYGIMTQLGLQVGLASNVDVQGTIAINSVPNLYAYRYKVNHAGVGIKGKWIATQTPYVQPYISSGLGASWNHAHGYNTFTNVAGLPDSPWLSPSTSVGFTYSVGLGVQKTFYKYWQLGVGYEFADLGKSLIGPSQPPLSIRGLQLTHLYIHQLQFGISYLC